MSFSEFARVLEHAASFNGPFTQRVGYPMVKYIHPSIDLRFNNVFSITFRGFGSEHVLHCQNECRALPDSLYDRCMKYLQGEK